MLNQTIVEEQVGKGKCVNILYKTEGDTSSRTRTVEAYSYRIINDEESAIAITTSHSELSQPALTPMAATINPNSL